MSLPAFNDEGDLPPGVFPAPLSAVLDRFGIGSPQRRNVAGRLIRIYQLAAATAQLRRFVVFASFVTAKEDPNDVDIVMIMEDSFDTDSLTGEVALLFQHLEAEVHFGASIF